MRVILSIIFIFSFAYQGLAQDEENLDVYKIESYHRMQRVGIGMAVSGGALTAFGAFMVSYAQHDTDAESFDQASMSILGAVSILVGVPLGATGIIIGSIGSQKLKELENRNRNKLSLHLGTQKNPNGFTLRYNL